VDHCIFTGGLFLSGLGKIALFHTNCGELSVFNSKLDELMVTGCRLGAWSLQRVAAKRMDTEENRIKMIQISDTEIQETVFDHRQLRLEALREKIEAGESRSEGLGEQELFRFIPYKTSLDLKKKEEHRSMVETLDFIRSATSISEDRGRFTELMYLEVLLKQDRRWERRFVRLTGGFLKPLRFIVLALGILVAFALLYMLPFLQFQSSLHGLMTGLDFRQALYFSGVTFTTIGYGDISPIDGARVLAVMEGILGISVMSCFLVALVKKYID